MKTVSFREFLELPDESPEILIDINSVEPHMQGDYVKRNNNVKQGKLLCNRCDGTGNELFSMYKKCSECNGEGYKLEVL